ncbi:MAG: hypothetical protein JWQ95_4351 [Sphaerisporangium sp.]|jgi:hypothetical protein|nr:hypothetical protein [Sphaerisporangium sp.]
MRTSSRPLRSQGRGHWRTRASRSWSGAHRGFGSGDLGALVKEELAARVHSVPVHVHTTDGATVLGNRLQLIGVLTNLVVKAAR